jgi:hypothetical protein
MRRYGPTGIPAGGVAEYKKLSGVMLLVDQFPGMAFAGSGAAKTAFVRVAPLPAAPPLTTR